MIGFFKNNLIFHEIIFEKNDFPTWIHQTMIFSRSFVLKNVFEHKTAIGSPCGGTQKDGICSFFPAGGISSKMDVSNKKRKKNTTGDSGKTC